jgi:hypothetical protein
MGITKQELDEIKRLGLTHLATLLETVAGKEIQTNLLEGTKGDKKTVDMKGHFDSMFEGQELDAEFVTKAKAIFETAVAEQAEIRLAEKFAAIDQAVQTQLVEHQADQDKRIDEYLDYVVKDWLSENQVAIEANAKVQKATALIEGLQTLLATNDIDLVEASKEDAFAQAISEKEETQTELIEAIRKINEAEKMILALQVETAINEAMKDMNEEQARSFLKIASELTVESIEEFEGKLQAISEAFEGRVVVAPAIDEEAVKIAELATQVHEAIVAATKDMKESDAKRFVEQAGELTVESFEDFESQMKMVSESFLTEEQIQEAAKKAELTDKVITAIQEATKDMADTEAERFTALVEELTVESFEDFESKLKTISETFVAKPAGVKKIDESIDPKMASYIAAARSLSGRQKK